MPDNALLFDIETIADLTVQNRDAISTLAQGRNVTPEEYGALCPPLARVVCIAWLDVATQRLGAVFDNSLAMGAPPATIEVAAEPGVVRPCEIHGSDGEPQVLRHFGQMIERHLGQPDARLVTYNGRGFDLPVLIHRSIKHGIVEGRSLLVKALQENRYRPLMHVDLMDRVTFYGAASRWPMAAYAIGYGWRSPKEDLSGAQVGATVHSGRILDVVRYCAGDVLATACVYAAVGTAFA